MVMTRGTKIYSFRCDNLFELNDMKAFQEKLASSYLEIFVTIENSKEVPRQGFSSSFFKTGCAVY